MTERARRVLVLLAVALAWLAVPRSARSAEFEVFIDAANEDELYELYATDQISETTYLALLDLMRRGTDLQTATREDLYALPNITYADADRILAYRKEAGTIRDPAALVAAGALSRRKLLALAPFLYVGEDMNRRPVNGQVRLQGVWTVGDKRAPAMMLQARVNAVRHLTVGLTGRLTRDRIGKVSWDPNRQALSAPGPKTRVDLPKVFIQWDTPEYGVIAGSYRIGFGQRLTLDNTNRYTPNGFTLDDSMYYRVRPSNPCRLSAGERAEVDCDGDFQAAPDHKIRYGLFGVAAGAKHIKVPVGWLQIYGFFSYQPRNFYQYYIYNKDTCPDPTLDTPGCSSPDLYARRDPLLEPSNRQVYQTLPSLFNLVTGGGNFSYFFDRRTHVGATGYGATPRWNVEGADLDFRPYTQLPYGGAFGAIGVDASWGYRWADVFAEFSRSFDSQQGDGNGGYAGIVRHTATFDNHELEVSARFYDKAFNNPFARPIAAQDQNDGLRASNEAGGRVRYNAYLLKRLDLRTLFDMWTDVDVPTPQIRGQIRGDVDATKWFRPGLQFVAQDRDVGSSGRGDCFYSYGSDSAVDENGLPVPVDTDDLENEGLPQACAGERYAVMARTRFQPVKQVWFALQYQHEFIDDPEHASSFRQDATAIGTITTRPIDPLSISLRVRYKSDDITRDDYLEEILWGYVEVSYRVRRWLIPRIRYDVYGWLDHRESTAAKHPNPVHWLWFELESRF